MMNHQHMTDRYVAVWNEPDANRRREAIAALWTPDGVTCHRLLESRGLIAIEERIRGAYLRWVQGNGCEFRSGQYSSDWKDVVMFNWRMVSKADQKLVSVGLSLLIMDAGGLIRHDFQVPEPLPAVDAGQVAMVESYLALMNNAHSERRHVRAAGRIDGHHNAIRFDWEVLPVNDAG